MKYITLKDGVVNGVFETTDFEECYMVPQNFSSSNIGKKRYDFDSNWHLIANIEDIEILKQVNDIMTQLIYLDEYVPRYFETSLMNIPAAMDEEIFPGITRGDMLKEKLELREKLKKLSR